MTLINTGTKGMRVRTTEFFALLAMLLTLGANVFAHNGEDHGDEKPKAATVVKGAVTRSARLGEYELTLKHPALEPDTATAARLFITKYQTNEAVGIDSAAPGVELEAPGGAITKATVEKNDAPGSYTVKIPALAEGSYTVRVGLKTDKGNDTATFSGVNVARPAAEDGASASSWLGTILFYLAVALILGLFGVLFYFAWRMAGGKRIGEEAASA